MANINVFISPSQNIISFLDNDWPTEIKEFQEFKSIFSQKHRKKNKPQISSDRFLKDFK